MLNVEFNVQWKKYSVFIPFYFITTNPDI